LVRRYRDASGAGRDAGEVRLGGQALFLGDRCNASGVGPQGHPYPDELLTGLRQERRNELQYPAGSGAARMAHQGLRALRLDAWAAARLRAAEAARRGVQSMALRGEVRQPAARAWAMAWAAARLQAAPVEQRWEARAHQPDEPASAQAQRVLPRPEQGLLQQAGRALRARRA
jgi:hypothetical protein